MKKDFDFSPFVIIDLQQKEVNEKQELLKTIPTKIYIGSQAFLIKGQKNGHSQHRL